MKNKEIVSEIVNDLRALNIDDRISSRYVLSKLRGFLALYIKRENDQRRLYDYDTLWLTVPCVEMEPSNDIECCGVVIPKCKTWMRSKKPIPEIYITAQGPAIQQLQSARGDIVFIKSTLKDYLKATSRRWQNPDNKYFWIENNHLVIPDSEIELVTLVAYFKDKKLGKELSGCPDTDCGEQDPKCALPLDEDFDCPDYLLAQVKQDTIANLFNFYKRNVVDDVPNLSTNQKANNKS